MAETGRLTQAARVSTPAISPVTLLRVAIILAVLAAWEFLAHSGWLYRDVVPSLLSIARALGALLTDRNYYFNLGVTAAEIGVALAIGGAAGLAVEPGRGSLRAGGAGTGSLTGGGATGETSIGAAGAGGGGDVDVGAGTPFDGGGGKRLTGSRAADSRGREAS